MLFQVFILFSTVKKNVIDNWEKFVLLKSLSNLEKKPQKYLKWISYKWRIIGSKGSGCIFYI